MEGADMTTDFSDDFTGGQVTAPIPAQTMAELVAATVDPREWATEFDAAIPTDVDETPLDPREWSDGPPTVLVPVETCQHLVLTWAGAQDDGQGGSLALWTCTCCGTTRTGGVEVE